MRSHRRGRAVASCSVRSLLCARAFAREKERALKISIVWVNSNETVCFFNEHLPLGRAVGRAVALLLSSSMRARRRQSRATDASTMASRGVVRGNIGCARVLFFFPRRFARVDVRDARFFPCGKLGDGARPRTDARVVPPRLLFRGGIEPKETRVFDADATGCARRKEHRLTKEFTTHRTDEPPNAGDDGRCGEWTGLTRRERAARGRDLSRSRAREIPHFIAFVSVDRPRFGWFRGAHSSIDVRARSDDRECDRTRTIPGTSVVRTRMRTTPRMSRMNRGRRRRMRMPRTGWMTTARVW